MKLEGILKPCLLRHVLDPHDLRYLLALLSEATPVTWCLVFSRLCVGGVVIAVGSPWAGMCRLLDRCPGPGGTHGGKQTWGNSDLPEVVWLVQGSESWCFNSSFGVIPADCPVN